MIRKLPPAPQTLRSYPIKYHKADAISDHLGSLLNGGKISFDDRTNTVIILGDPAVHSAAEAIIRLLDQQQPGRRQTRVFQLRSIIADKHLIEILKIAIGTEVQLAVDVRTNSIVVSGDETDHSVVSKLLTSLDTPSQVRPARKMSVRIMWLVSRGEAYGSPLPKDLKEVAAELEKIGIKDLRMAAHILVSATDGAEFMSRGQADLAGMVDLNVKGTLNPSNTAGTKTGKSRLEISIDAAPEKTGGKTSVQTTIDAPAGHFVVLGVAPFDKYDSVFVVQVRQSP